MRCDPSYHVDYVGVSNKVGTAARAFDRKIHVVLARNPIFRTINRPLEQTLTECVERSAPVEHEIVAILYLGKEQPMLATLVLAFVFGEERREAGQPLLAAGQQIFRREQVSQMLSLHFRKTLEDCWKSMFSSRIRWASQ